MENSKIVWSEGMFMQPHHFQQWDRYNENTLKFRLNSLVTFPWGVSHIEMDKEAIENGTFSLLSFRGIMDDGLPINIPENDPPPAMRDIKDSFPPSSDVLEVFLTIPSIKMGSQVCKMADDTDELKKTRLQQEFISVVDENGGHGECKIPVARKKIELRFSGESLDDYTVLKIAEVIRSQTGAYSIRQDFVPPSLSIASCPHLINFVGRVYEKLISKCNALRDRRGQKSQEMAEFGAADITNLWMLYSVNSYIPLLKHMFETKNCHPEQLYLTLARMFGELTTFSSDITSKEVPSYNHKNLSDTFKDLEEKFNSLTEVVSSTKFISIPTNKVRDLLFSGQITDEDVIERSKIYLAIGGDMPAEEVLEKIPKMVKISSLDTIDLIISANMHGVTVRHEPRIPSAIPVKMGFHYFSLENYGKFWEGIRESRSIAIALPHGFSEAQIELIAVKS